MFQKNTITVLSLLFLSTIFSTGLVAGQPANPWSFVTEKEQDVERIATMRSGDFFPATQYSVFTLDSSKMAKLVSEVPFENLRNFESDIIIPIPLPTGEYEYFRIAESPVFAPELAAKFPNIKSYKAISEGSSGRTGRISVSPIGIAGMFNTTNGDLFIERYEFGEKGDYAVFYDRDMAFNREMQDEMRCGFDGFSDANRRSEILEEVESIGRSMGGNELELRVYRMALATTSAYADLKGGTLESVMASLNEAMNLLNQITENEVAIRFELVPNNHNIIWLDPADEPYENVDEGRGLLGQNTSAIASHGGIPLNQFDVGHVFTGRCNDVGGVVNGRACTPGKARGVTCHSNNNMSSIVTRIFAHEVGHQFNVAHSWNHCPGLDNQRSSSSAYEPGSGSTIMSYAGSCGSQNVQTNTHAYFHAGSLNEWIAFSRLNPDNANCGEVIFTGNTEPEIFLPYENDFHIPISTPFKLTAEATDADDDPLTFAWEQMDLGPNLPMQEAAGTIPLFRTFPPSVSPTRYFPNLQAAASGSNDITQQLPTYSRVLNFRCTVRDNNPAGGAIVWDQLRFFATAAAGPFEVTFPGSGQSYRAGELVEITWDVANTDQSPVNAEYVDILFSFNRGLSFPIVLMERTPNTGSAMVQLPNTGGPWNRIKVRASDNIFFNVSQQNFGLDPAEQPGFIFRHNPGQDLQCLPDVLNIKYRTEPLLNFNDSIVIEIVDGLPDGAVALFPDYIEADEEGELSIDLSGVNINADHELTFRLKSGQDTLYRTVYFTTVSNDFSAVELSWPENGADGVDQIIPFAWNPSDNAESYHLEVALNPAFEENQMVFSETVTGIAEIQPEFQFPANTLLYWRVTPINQCGVGEPLTAGVFQTRTVSCETFEASGHPIVNSGVNGSVNTSEILIENQGQVDEINIPNLSGLQSWVGDIGFTLISPSGTEVPLFTRRCGNLSHYNLGFDDNSPIELGCPLISGQRYQPQEPLANFAGEPLEGIWTMELRRYNSGSSGRWDGWSMEVCANLSLPGLQLTQIDTLFAPPLERTRITSSLLRVENGSTTNENIKFTVIEPPALGSLIFDNTDQSAGFVFTQQDILDGRVRYRADIDGEGDDHFTFSVIDDESAWTGPDTFFIAIREDAVSNTTEISSTSEFKVFPNPTGGHVTLQKSSDTNQSVQIRLYNSTGQLVHNSVQLLNGGVTQLELSNLSPGLYVVQMSTEANTFSERLIIK